LLNRLFVVILQQKTGQLF